MLVVFANNQVIVAAASLSATIYTDPVPLGGNDRATPVTNIHAIFNAAAAGLDWIMEMSNDGQTWVPQGPVSGALTTEGATPQTPALVTGVYARLKITFTASSAGMGAAIFDIHVNFDHA